MRTHDDDRPHIDLDEIRASLTTRPMEADDVRATLGVVRYRRGWHMWRDAVHTASETDERPHRRGTEDAR